jgi:hypothetical protein
MKITGALLLIIAVLTALVLLTLGAQAVEQQPPTITWLSETDMTSCAAVTVERVGDQPVRVVIDLKCYGANYCAEVK